MSAEFIATMGDGAMYYTFEHDVTRYVIGDVESVRARLTDALEQMGYRVLNEDPIQAKRSAKGAAASGCSQDILNYPTTLSVGLKSAGANSTRVAFDYSVKNVYTGYLSKGDRNTLTREAEAILAQAMARAITPHCPACGADTASSSRFCRQCGAPLTVATTAEMEVLRMTSNANASYKNLLGGTVFLLLAPAVLLFLLLGSDDPVKYAKLLKVLSFFSITLGGVGLTMLWIGLARLRQTVRRDIETDSTPTPPRRTFSAPNTAALPPQSVSHSVTETTTDLLPHEVKQAS